MLLESIDSNIYTKLLSTIPYPIMYFLRNAIFKSRLKYHQNHL